MFSYFLKWELLLGPFLSLLFRDRVSRFWPGWSWTPGLRGLFCLSLSSLRVGCNFLDKCWHVSDSPHPPKTGHWHTKGTISPKSCLVSQWVHCGYSIRAQVLPMWVTHQLLQHCRAPPQQRYQRSALWSPLFNILCLLCTLAPAQDHPWLGQEEVRVLRETSPTFAAREYQQFHYCYGGRSYPALFCFFCCPD